VQEKQSVTASVCLSSAILMLLLTLRETYALNRLSSFKNLRRKGAKFDHRPGRPKVLLRHWFKPTDGALLCRLGINSSLSSD